MYEGNSLADGVHVENVPRRRYHFFSRTSKELGDMVLG